MANDEEMRTVCLIQIYDGAIVALMRQASRHTAATDVRRHAPSLDEVRAALQAAGCRFTAQRGEVWSYLASVENHPTAEQVYRAVRRRIPQISLATVYNALEALVAARLATKITSGNGPACYDCRGEDHYHLRDVETGEVRDLPAEFDQQLLEKLDPRLVERLAKQVGFTVTGYRLEVLGRFDAGQRPKIQGSRPRV
jgi:Fur family peroxide stress response transcriptional regulator